MKHAPQLDGLRTVAIAAVIVCHFAPGEWFARLAPLAHTGVRLFFVLSGFLITGILLDCRRLAEAGAGRWRLAARFYARRTLRIFPAYYLVLAAALALGLGMVREDAAWYATYTCNWIPTFLRRLPAAGHLWSLAVEEQFYLVWPWLVLLLPRRASLPAIAALAALAPASRLLLDGYATTSCLDSLGVGAALAYFHERRRAAAIALAGGLPLTAAAALAGLESPAGRAMFDTGTSLVFAWLVSTAADGRLARWLASPPAVYVGRISYGLYLYHGFAPWVLPAAARRLGLPYPSAAAAQILLMTLATLAAAVISWHCFEAPVNRLKRFLPYH